VTKPNHGGKRTGAGRKPLAEKTIRASITLLESDHAYLLAINSELSKAVRTLIAASRDT
jgi:hypothetical protein